MSLRLTVPLVTTGYGLKDEDFDEIIRMDRLRDISKPFSKSIQLVEDAFGSKARIRLIEFNEASGVDMESNAWYRTLIFAQKHLFYTHLHSNRDCCVLFKYTGLTIKRELFEKRYLPHEFAHHHQFTSQYPCFLPKGSPRELFPQFARVREIGPRLGAVYIDNTLLDDKPVMIIKDFCERVADSICEGIIIEKGFAEGILDEYKEKRCQDPAKNYPRQLRSQIAVEIRYMRRLVLLDAAEWNAILSKIYRGDMAVKRLLVYEKKWAIHLNKRYSKAKHAFKKIREILLKTDFRSFKEEKNTVGYIKRVMTLLGIRIRTKESW